jgi:hypothetical protein
MTDWADGASKPWFQKEALTAFVSFCLLVLRVLRG